MTGDSDGSLKLWDLNLLGLSFVADLNQASNETSSLVFYQNFLITGHFDGFIKMWKMNSFQLWYSTRAHNSKIACLANININERNLFATGSADNKFKIWDSDFKEIQTVSGHSGTIIALIYLNNANSLISTSSDMKFNIYRTKNIQQNETWNRAHNRSVPDIAIIDERTIATCSGDRTIKVWNNSILVANLTDHIDYVYSLEYSSRDNLLLSSSRDNLVKVWNIPAFTLNKT